MSEEKKTEKVEEQAEEVVKGARGELGVATAALTIKQGWHSAHFKQVSIKDAKGEHVKFDLVQNPGAPSLRQYARSLVSSGDQTAKDWFSHKAGSLNAKRSDANIKAAHEAGAATKMQKRKKKGDNQAKAK